MDYRNKIFVIYDQTSELDLAQYFQELTREYSNKIIELRNTFLENKHRNIFFVTSSADNLEILYDNFSKYTKNLHIVIMTADKSVMTRKYPKNVHTIFTNWLALAQKFSYHYGEMEDIFEKMGNRGQFLSYFAKQDADELRQYGGQAFLNFIKEYHNET